MDELEYQLRAQESEQRKQLEQNDGPDNSVATFVDPTDGVVYEWDAEKKGWFPKIDSNFMAAYKMSYGGSAEAPVEKDSIQDVSNKDVGHVSIKEKEPADDAPPQKKKHVEKPEWFELNEKKNTNVYVSGLPQDITYDEFHEIMKKGGLIAVDSDGEPKVKLYTENGHTKGDGKCCYLKVESVALAIQLIHESTVRGHVISVEQAKFTKKGEYRPELKKKKKKPKNKRGNMVEKLLDWKERPENSGPRRFNYEKVVILRHAFHPKEFEEDPTLINDIRDDITKECENFGVVRKCTLYDRHPDGIVSVTFKDFDASDNCIQVLNGRWFGGQQLEATQWDGLSQYDVEETTEERSKRLAQWETFIQS